MARNKIRILPVSTSELKLRKALAVHLLREGSWTPRWVWDPSNGLIRITVTDGLSGGHMCWLINIWDPRLLLRAAANGAPFAHKFSPWIHEHPYVLRSTILTGSLSHTEYEVIAARHGAWRKWGRTPSRVSKRGFCDIFARPSRQLKSGTQYRLQPGVFHTVVPTASPTVTFVEQDLRGLRGPVREQLFALPASRSRMEIRTNQLYLDLSPEESSYVLGTNRLDLHPAAMEALGLCGGNEFSVSAYAGEETKGRGR